MGQELSGHKHGEAAAPRRALDDAPLIGVLYWTLTGGVTDANDVFLSIVGYTRDDLEAGRIDWFAMTPEEWRAADAKGMVQVRDTGRHAPFEKEFVRKNAARVPVLIGSALYPDSQTEGVSFVLDLSGRKAAEQGALERTVQQRIAGVLESITDAFVALDAQWRITYMNAEAERLMGRHRNEFIGRSHWEVWPASVGTEVERQYRRVAAEQVPAQFENLYDDGQMRVWFEVRAFPAEGGGVSVFYRDITAEKEARDTAERAERQLRLVIDAAPLLISYVDAHLRYRFVNQAYTRWFGRPALEIVGKHVEEVVGPATFAAVRPHLLTALSGERVSYEAKLDHKDGGRRFVHTDLVPDVPAEGGPARGLVGVVTDITARRGAELRQQFLADLSEQTRFLADPAEVVWETVSAVGEFLGLSRFLYADVQDMGPDAGAGGSDGTVTVHRDWHRGEGVGSVQGTWPFSSLGDVVGELRAGRTVVISDFASDPRAAGQYASVYEPLRVRAAVRVPVLRDGAWVALFSAQCATPRAWTAAEVELLETVAQRMWLTLENARLRRADGEGAERQRRFLREMLYGLTEGKLRLCNTAAELPAELPPANESVELTAPTLRLLRRQVEGVTEALRFAKERTHDLLTASGEAAKNAVRHAGGGVGSVHADPKAAVIQVWVRDTGRGIAEESIHRAIEQGWTTGGFGAGFFLMRQTCDRVYLLTGTAGTTIVVEMDRTPPLPVWLDGGGTGNWSSAAVADSR